MALVYTATRVGVPERAGRQKKVTTTYAVTSYLNPGGIALVLSELGVSRLEDLSVQALTSGYVWQWDGSLTAPVIKVYRQTAASSALVEVPDTTDVGSAKITAYGR